eukprot:gene41554-55091_t
MEFIEILGLLGAYGPSVQWLSALTSLMIHDIEENGNELCDDLMKLILKIKTERSGDPEKTSFSNFFLPSVSDSTERVICRILPAHNQLGLRIWEAGLFAAEFFLRNPEFLRDKDVLELGAGVGNTGLIMWRAGLAFKSYVMSDYSEETLNNLRYNISLNSKHSCDRDVLSVLKVRRMDWSSPDVAVTLGVSDPIPDVILAADCVYSEDLTCHLVNALLKILLITPRSPREEPTLPNFETSTLVDSDVGASLSSMENVPVP